MIDVPLPAGWTARRFDRLIATVKPRMPEAAWANVVHQLLDAYGWERLHIPPVKAGVRWITPGRKGFPDVCAVHPDGVCLVLELKTDAAKFDKPEQRKWMALWQRVAANSDGAVVAAVVRPADVEAVIAHIVPPSLAGAVRTVVPLPLDSAGKLRL